MSYNGTELRQALAAVPETPEQPYYAGGVVGAPQTVPLHADQQFVEVSLNDAEFQRSGPVTPSGGSAANITPQMGEVWRVRFVAVNPNGETNGSELTITG